MSIKAIPRWPRHKLTPAEGERILWHVLDHLNSQWNLEPCVDLSRAMITIRNLLLRKP